MSQDKIKCIIIDDNSSCTQHLNRLLVRNYSDKMDIVCHCKTIESGISAIKEKNPDLIFLDIEIGNETGFNLLAGIDFETDFDVIITTSYAGKFETTIADHGFHYLRKSIMETELRKIMDTCFINRNNPDYRKRLKEQIGKLRINNKSFKTISINKKLYKEANILYGEAHAESSFIYLAGQQMNKEATSHNLKYWEKEFDNKHFDFFRIHEKYLINIKYIECYNKREATLKLKFSALDLHVARERKRDFEEAWQLYKSRENSIIL